MSVTILYELLHQKNKRLRPLVFSLLCIFSVTLILSGEARAAEDDYTPAMSKYGSQGQEVTAIQQSLKSHGYFNDRIDGIYGKKTRDAVVWFQREQGLNDDGVVGPLTLAALGLSTGSAAGGYSQSDVNLMARVISAEARGESYLGQVAVGAVILNRVEHPSFPDSISGVCYQPGAFSSITSGAADHDPTESCMLAAQDALNGLDPTGGALYFYNPKYTKDEWIRSRPVIKTIGNHRFCG